MYKCTMYVLKAFINATHTCAMFVYTHRHFIINCMYFTYAVPCTKNFLGSSYFTILIPMYVNCDNA